MDLAINYKKNPPKDDFMAEVLDLLGDNIMDDLNTKHDDGDEEFWNIIVSEIHMRKIFDILIGIHKVKII